ncbi:MAG: C2 domain-containing protein [Armatimonadetes bacterium]|nr:C2 domain-containing protein [Armatimonadota bacterium]
MAFIAFLLAVGCSGGDKVLKTGSDSSLVDTTKPDGQKADTSGDGINPCASCSGCCFAGNQCMPGNSVAACGFGGLTCQTCSGSDECQNGSCIPQAPQCNASNCVDGCCSSANICVKPPTTSACGLKGGACKTCTGSQVCQAGTCEAAASKTYAVTVNSAEVSNADCGGWTDGCDAYVEVALGGGALVKAPYVQDSEKPVWDFKLFDATDKELLATQLKVHVADDDGWPNPDDELGTCDLTVAQTELDAGKLVADCGTKVKNLTFSFKLSTP